MSTISIKQGTSIIWTPDSAPLFDFAGLANGSAWQGVKQDLGATFAERYGFMLKTKGASAFTADAAVRLFLSFSFDDTLFAGGASGANEAYSDADDLANLLELRSVVTDADTNSHTMAGAFFALARYVAPVLYNQSGQSLTSTDADHSLRIWPLLGDIT